jgi:hypothetical protein
MMDSSLLSTESEKREVTIIGDEVYCSEVDDSLNELASVNRSESCRIIEYEYSCLVSGRRTSTIMLY